MKKQIIVSVLAAIVAVTGLTGCKKVYTYTTDDYLNVYVDGVDGEGKAEVHVDSDTFRDKINNDLFGGNGTELEIARIEFELYDAVDYEIVGDADGLKNGDTVSVVMTADNDRLKELGMKFALDSYTYTVSDLPVPTELDIFNGVTVTFEGISPKITAALNKNTTDDIYAVGFNGYLDKTSGLKNGDTVTLKGSLSQDAIEKLNQRDGKYYVAGSDEKTFTVSGYDEYLCEKTDLSELESKMSALVDGFTTGESAGSYKIGSEIIGRGIFKGGSYTEKYTLNSVTATPVKRVLLYGGGQSTNCYSVFYRLIFEAERKGTVTESDNIFVRVDMPNIIKKADGTISYNDDDMGYYGYTPSLFSNFVGYELEDVYSDYLVYMPEYDIAFEENL